VREGGTTIAFVLLGDTEGEAPREREPVGVPDLLPVGVWVVLGVDVGERVDVGVSVEVGDGVRDVVDVMEGLAPMERDDVGDIVALEDREGVVETVEGGDAVGVIEDEGVAVGDGVGLAETDADKEVLAVLEGEAPTVKDDVGDDVTVELPLIVLLGVICAVSVPLCVGEEVVVGENVGMASIDAKNEGLPKNVTLAVKEAELPAMAEAVRVDDGVLLVEGVIVGVVDPETVKIPVVVSEEPLFEGELPEVSEEVDDEDIVEVGEGVGVLEIVTVGVTLREGVVVTVCVPEPVFVKDEEGVLETVASELGEDDNVEEPVGESEAVEEGVGVGVGVGLEQLVEVGVRVDEGELEGVRELL